jgi:hypothetical protein
MNSIRRFADLRKVSIKLVMAVRPNRINILPLEGFKILYLIDLTNAVDIFQVLLNSDKNDAYFP